MFSHISRLIRCVIDCQICLEDSTAVANALELARSFGARVWDDSPLQMKQIEQIGIVAVRKLAAAGITSIEALSQTEAHQIDMILSRNPPFGVKVLGRLAEFPRLRVSVKMTGMVCFSCQYVGIAHHPGYQTRPCGQDSFQSRDSVHEREGPVVLPETSALRLFPG